MVGLLVRGILWALGTFAGRLLLNLGIGYVAYQGVDTLLNAIKSDIASNMGQLSAEAAEIAGICNVPAAVSILLSALTMRFSLGATKRLTMNPK